MDKNLVLFRYYFEVNRAPNKENIYTCLVNVNMNNEQNQISFEKESII
jgi:hypothetical protein